MGIVGTLLQEEDGVVIGRGRMGCLPWREWAFAKKRLLFDMLDMRASGDVLSTPFAWWYCWLCCCCDCSSSSSVKAIMVVVAALRWAGQP